MAETKTKAFRADEKTINRINAWMERDGIGNSEALERMADIIDMSEAKGALAGRSTEISNFESLVHQLTTAYTASLQLAQNTELNASVMSSLNASPLRMTPLQTFKYVLRGWPKRPVQPKTVRLMP